MEMLSLRKVQDQARWLGDTTHLVQGEDLMSNYPEGDRRKIVRHRVHYRMDVSNPAGEFFGCLLDVSSSGMRVQTSEDVDVLNVTKLHIELPRWLELGETIRIQGRFVWCKGKARGKMEAGFSFDGLREGEQDKLDNLVDRITQAAEDDGCAK